MDYKKAKPLVGEWWVVAIENSANRSVQQVEFIHSGYITFAQNAETAHIDDIEWIKLVDVWDDEKPQRKKK